VPKTSIPYVDRVTNHEDATGGLDSETIEMAQIRAPQILRTRGRAVTPDDYESLARLADPRVQRARCVQPAAGGAATGPLAGQIYLLVVPKVYRPERRITGDQLQLEDDLQESVRRYLDEYRLLTVRLDIREPEYQWIEVDIVVMSSAETDPERVRADVEQQLYRYFNPIIGGPDGTGWSFGRDLYPSDVYSCLRGVHGIEFIESARLYHVPTPGDRKEITTFLELPVHGLIVSNEHRVNVHLQE
jgi:predicted phage baseplate assembly protein